MVTESLIELRRKMHVYSENCNKEMENIKKYESELKNTIN